jgi:folate-binding protein YgfZ
MTSGYAALRQGVAWLDLSGRGKLAVRGPDRVRILHALTTNDVQGLAAGQGCYAFFLNAQGKILADVNLFCNPEEILLDTEPETAASLFEHIDRYIIADDATVTDLTADLQTFSIEGPESAHLLKAVGAPVPADDYSILEWREGFVARANTTGQPGFLLFVPHVSRAEIILDLERAGARKATPDDARTVRIENGRPRYGEEISTRYIGPEAGQDHAIHPRKGCYLGQEVVERVRSRGLLGRVLVPVRFDTSEPPVAGTKLFAGDARAGEVASSVYSPQFGTSIGLAYVRIDILRSEPALTCSDAVKVHIREGMTQTPAQCNA